AELRAPVQLGRWPDIPDHPDIRALYLRLLKAIDKPLFHDGEWRLLGVSAPGGDSYTPFVAGAGGKGKDRAIVPANITQREAQGLVDVGDLPQGDAFQLVDQLADRSFRWARADLAKGLYVRLSSGDAHLFLLKQ